MKSNGRAKNSIRRFSSAVNSPYRLTAATFDKSALYQLVHGQIQRKTEKMPWGSTGPINGYASDFSNLLARKRSVKNRKFIYPAYELAATELQTIDLRKPAQSDAISRPTGKVQRAFRQSAISEWLARNPA